MLLVVLGAAAVTALWFERALMNFGRNDSVARELFAHFRAPEGLVRPRAGLVAKAPPLSVDVVLARAADVRDGRLDAPLSTLDAVNAVLAKAHAHFDWRQEARRAARQLAQIDYRSIATDATARTLAASATAYDWLLRHLLGRCFALWLRFLDAREHRRGALAQERGDVFAAAWLSAHYRNERCRVSRHWALLQKARDPLTTRPGEWSRTRDPASTDA